MIKSYDLIMHFQMALDDRWGYIWGTAGVQWTAAKQKQKVNYMVTKYGTNWQKNSEAKNDNYYSAALYGEKWVGHMVADCSGLFAWSFAQLGGAIAHGSNSIYDRYCSKKGKLDESLKKKILPGTAVFTGTEKTHGHIGLYVGNGKVIEASGTQAGVCVSNITAGKWTYYGFLKDVEYDGAMPETDPVDSEPTLKRGSKGEAVKKMQTLLYGLGYGLGSWGIDGDFGSQTEKAVKEFQSDHGLTVDGICGPKTWAALKKAGDSPIVSDPAIYEVRIRKLTKAQADDLKAKYPDATILIPNE